ncbi:hypothetical protein LTSEMIN_0704, partial [Salmonella enterica subsp. enterica serovar Minnesota str. A4-603]
MWDHRHIGNKTAAASCFLDNARTSVFWLAPYRPSP